jgi:hypothetical protein
LLVYGVDIEIDEDVRIDNFTNLIDDLSWEEFMPSGVDKKTFNKFAKYYDKDIFLASSRRIRYISKSADELEPTKRVKKIAALFSTFKNPDKETVLTPWKTVNKHLGDVLGGYNFFDESKENDIEEPRLIEHGDVTNNTLLNSESQILEINSKSGLYPLYVTYSIYKHRLSLIDEKNTTFKLKNKIWDDVVMKNIFVICKTKMAKSITRRTLVGYRESKVNARYFEDLVNQLKQESKFSTFKRKIHSGKSYWKAEGKGDDMRFNAIVGNPPYQEIISNNKKNSSLSKQLFPTFIMATMRLKPDYSSLITPSRWFKGNAQDKSFIKLREFLMENNHIKKIVNYTDERELFNNVTIAGGINYYLFEKDYSGDIEFVEVKNGEQKSTLRPLFEDGLDIVLSDGSNHEIIRKLLAKDFISLTTVTKGRNAFGVTGKVANKVSQSEFKEGFVELRCAYEEIRWIDPKKITKNYDLVKKWKIFTSKGNGGAGLITDDKVVAVLGKAFVGSDFSACTDSLIPIGNFETKIEAENLQKYMSTKFLRYVVGILKTSQNVSQNVYQFVPLQDFTTDSEIDWSSDISEIDRQLYAKYQFSDEEISKIENKIKYI